MNYNATDLKLKHYILVLPGCGEKSPVQPSEPPPVAITECTGPIQSCPGYSGYSHTASFVSNRPTESMERQALEYGDGFLGRRACKSRQVKKLQCMLNHLGYCTGGVDGQYGDETVKAVRQYFANYSHIIANREGQTDGRSLSWPQWRELELENQAGSQCSKYGTFE
jgi:hypothetical protein